MSTDPATDPRVAICLGPGGVGKTTTAAALALAAANRGERAVVLTIDPARRLADAMGLDDLGDEPQLIDGPWPGELWACMLDRAATFDRVIDEHAHSSDQAEKIRSNPLFVSLTSSLSGTHEYMAVERLRMLTGEGRFDLVVVDTPPARHAIDFLDSPGRLVRFVDHQLYRSVLAPRHGLMRALNLAAQLAMKTIGRVVGTGLLNDIVVFFEAFDGMDEGFKARAHEINEMLLSPRTSYVLVTAARTDPLASARWIADALVERGRAVDVLVANRLTPQHLADTEVAELDRTKPLEENLAQLAQLAQQEQGLLADFATDLADPRTVRLDDRSEPIADLEGLRALAEQFPD